MEIRNLLKFDKGEKDEEEGRRTREPVRSTMGGHSLFKNAHTSLISSIGNPSQHTSTYVRVGRRRYVITRGLQWVGNELSRGCATAPELGRLRPIELVGLCKPLSSGWCVQSLGSLRPCYIVISVSLV